MTEETSRVSNVIKTLPVTEFCKNYTYHHFKAELQKKKKKRLFAMASSTLQGLMCSNPKTKRAYQSLDAFHFLHFFSSLFSFEDRPVEGHVEKKKADWSVTTPQFTATEGDWSQSMVGPC